MNELFVAQPDVAGSGIKVSGALAAGQITGSIWLWDSQYIAFICQGDTAGLSEAYVVPRSGGSRVKVSPTLGAGGVVNTISPHFAAQRLILSVKLDGAAKSELLLFVFRDGTNSVKFLTPVPAGPGPFSVAASW